MEYEQYFTYLKHLLDRWLQEEILDYEAYTQTFIQAMQMSSQGTPVEQLPYYGFVLQGWAEAQGLEAAGAPMTGITGGYETQEVAGNTLAILRDDEGNVVDTINLGIVEAGGITPSQQAELDLLNQKFQFQQQQWMAETAMSQQQQAQQLAYQQAQMAQQAAMQQAGMGFEAQMAQMPYQGMTAYQQAEMDLANRQYQAEMMANPSRWIEAYYGQQMPPTPPTQMPQIQIPQIQVPQMPPIEYPPWFTPEMFMPEEPLPEEVPPVARPQPPRVVSPLSPEVKKMLAGREATKQPTWTQMLGG